MIMARFFTTAMMFFSWSYTTAAGENDARCSGTSCSTQGSNLLQSKANSGVYTASLQAQGASLCAEIKGQNALDFWLPLFHAHCHVEATSVPNELKDKIRETTTASMAKVVEGANSPVTCRVHSAAATDGDELVYEALLRADGVSWNDISGSAELNGVLGGAPFTYSPILDAGYPGYCHVFSSDVPRLFDLNEFDFDAVLDVYRAELKDKCPLSTDVLVPEKAPSQVTRNVGGDGVWHVTDFHARYGSSSPGVTLHWLVESNGDIIVVYGLHLTHPAPCSLCNNCSSNDFSLSSKKSRVGHKPSGGTKTDDAAGERRFGFGDNFHSVVLPNRTAAEHARILAHSAALIHVVASERGYGSEHIQTANNNYVKDGSFEITDPPSRTTEAGAGSSVGAWSVTGGKVEYGSITSRTHYGNLAAHGNSFLHLCHPSATETGVIEQEVDTEAGISYHLTLKFAANPENKGKQGLQVEVHHEDGAVDSAESPRWEPAGGYNGPYDCDASPLHNCWAWQNLHWKTYGVSFTAKGAKTRVKIKPAVAADTSADASADPITSCTVLDDVWITLPPFSGLPETYNFFDNAVHSGCWRAPISQGECGSCWAFAAIGAIEKQYCARAHGAKFPYMSREMLVRCSVRNNGCGGGNADAAYGDMMEIGGLWSTKCLPYQGTGSKHCPAFAYSWFGQGAKGKTGKFGRVDQEMAANCDDTRRYSNRPPIGEEWNVPFTMVYAARTGRFPDFSDPELRNYRAFFAKARSHDNIPSWWVSGEKAMMSAVVKYHSVYASFIVKDDFQTGHPLKRQCDDHCWPWGQMYGEDGYQAQCGGCGAGHAIHIYGYGTEFIEHTWFSGAHQQGPKLDFWNIENSWGAEAGTHMDQFQGEPDDPFSWLHPVDAADKCVLAFAAKSSVSRVKNAASLADGFRISLFADSEETPIADPIDIPAGQTAVFQYTLDLAGPGPHYITYVLNGKNHKRSSGFPVEDYELSMPLLRCRGRGFRLDFLNSAEEAEVSWNRKTRADLMEEADQILADNDIEVNTSSGLCPMPCKTGQRHPDSGQTCMGLLSDHGYCYEDSEWASQYMEYNCSFCDIDKANIEYKAQAILAWGQNNGEEFTRWYVLINEALTAPDEPGWAKWGTTCNLMTFGFGDDAGAALLTAKYSFEIPDQNKCDRHHSAMIVLQPADGGFEDGTHQVFVNPDVEMNVGDHRTVACPAPLQGTVLLACGSGSVLRAKSHSCKTGGGINSKTVGYYRMRKGINYHGIEDGAAYAIAELGVTNEFCPTTSWTRWALCQAEDTPCAAGHQTRTRARMDGGNEEDAVCKGTPFTESRPCRRPGFCSDILVRFSQYGASSAEAFMVGYMSASTELPAPKAGAHMLKSIYTECSVLEHWCSVITGRKTCTVLYQAQFEIKKKGNYRLELAGNSYTIGRDSELVFSPQRDRNAIEQKHFRVKKDQGMEEFVDAGNVHRRRRAGEDQSKWESSSYAHFEQGMYPASLLLEGWSSCPDFKIELHEVVPFQPAVVHGLSRDESSAEFVSGGPKISFGPYNKQTVGKLYGKTWRFTDDDIYTAFGMHKYTESFERDELEIVGQTVLPEPGKYTMEVRLDVECTMEQLWKYCDQSDNSESQKGKIDLRIKGSSGYAYKTVRNGFGVASLAFDTNVSTFNGVVDFTLKLDMAKGAVRYSEGMSVTKPDDYVAPNKVEIWWSKLDPTAAGAAEQDGTIDMKAHVQYHQDVDLIMGEGLTRVAWPDRDMPFANEYQVQPFEAVPPGLILLGARDQWGFAAETEARVDAGACVSLVAQVVEESGRQVSALSQQMPGIFMPGSPSGGPEPAPAGSPSSGTAPLPSPQTGPASSGPAPLPSPQTGSPSSGPSPLPSPSAGSPSSAPPAPLPSPHAGSPSSSPASSTGSPTNEPTLAGTLTPTGSPTSSPTSQSTSSPTASPTAAPTTQPTATPTPFPTRGPTPAMFRISGKLRVGLPATTDECSRDFKNDIVNSVVAAGTRITGVEVANTSVAVEVEGCKRKASLAQVVGDDKAVLVDYMIDDIPETTPTPAPDEEDATKQDFQTVVAETCTACGTVVVDALGVTEVAAGDQFHGFGLQLCDTDGDHQYLEFFKLVLAGVGHREVTPVSLGWVHTEFTHPTHLRISRDMATRQISLGYRPDNRAYFAHVWDNVAEMLKVPDEFWNTKVHVGVSMGTERPYRIAEFYNISIDECPTKCDVGGRTTYCGEMQTPCGGTLNCPAECDAGDFCVEGHCFTCPEAEEHADWECGVRTEICQDHEGRKFEKDVPIGDGCVQGWSCMETIGENMEEKMVCQCDPLKDHALRALGFECGTMPDGCGGKTDLGTCAYVGNEHATCVDNRCECTPKDWSTDPAAQDWNCGSAPSGCGKPVYFGDLLGACAGGDICTDHKCCTPAEYSPGFECGSEYDTCTKQTTYFTKAQESWELIFRQTADSHVFRTYGSGFNTVLNYNTPDDPNYIRSRSWYYDGDGLALFTGDDDKLKLKLVYYSEHANDGVDGKTNVWKQNQWRENCYSADDKAAGYEPLNIQADVADSKGFRGLCYEGGSYTEMTGHTSARRRRFRESTLMVMQKGGVSGGLSTPIDGKKAHKIELYATQFNRKDGSCPRKNGQCDAEAHTCSCTPDAPPAGSNCGSFSDGCGVTISLGTCPKGEFCESTTNICGDAPLTFLLLDRLRTCMAKFPQRMHDELPNAPFHAIKYGTSGSSIYDGGSDMYDGANMVWVRGSDGQLHKIDYTQDCSATFNTVSDTDIEYFTCKLTDPVTAWFAGFKSKSKSIHGLKVTGNLGADGQGHIKGGTTQPWHGGGVNGYWTKVYGARNDASINHLMMLPSLAMENGATHTWNSNTGNENDNVVTSAGADFLLYVLFAGTGGYEFADANFDNVMKAITPDCKG